MTEGTAIVPAGTVQSTRLRPLLRMIDGVGHWLFGGSERRPIRMAALRKAAERKTGYADWGLTPSYERGAELLEKDLADFPGRFLGRFTTADTLREHHENRLRLHAAMAEPDPDAGLKHPPYIITGLFRCGTTLMHNLLSAVPGRGFVPFWELKCPTVVPGRERIARMTVRSVRIFSPEHHTIHPLYWDGAEECWMLMAQSLRAPSFTVALDVPNYAAWLDEHDMLEPYLEYRATLEQLSQSRDTTLVMKGPGHTGCIDALHRAVPEARIVFLHRDPAKAVSPYCSLSAVHHRTFYGSYDAEAIGAKVLERFARFTEAAMEQRSRIPDESIIDVYFEDLVDDPVATIRRIGEHFGDEWSDEAEVAVRAKLAELPRHKYGKHHYSAAQWGLTADGIRERFADYLREHDLRREAC